MSLSQRLLPDDDLSRREVETSQYGDVDEAYRVYEDIFALGVWPSEQEILDDAECDEAAG